MAKKKHHQTGTIQNRRARYDYELGDSLVVGLELTGAETKALRLGHGQLRGSYVTVKDNELWLLNAAIIGTAGVPIEATEQTRTRRLLAKRREIDALITAKQQGSTIVPLELLIKGRYIKPRIAIGKGKRQYDKRRAIQKRESDRRIAAELKRG
jgi:SsrA-binding protein